MTQLHAVWTVGLPWRLKQALKQYRKSAMLLSRKQSKNPACKRSDIFLFS